MSNARRKIGLLGLGGLFALLLFLAIPALAQAPVDPSGALGLTPPVQSALGLGADDIRIVVAKIIRAALGLLGILAVGLMIYAGFIWMTAGGNEEKITEAKKMLGNAAIGLAIILSAFAIASFVINRLVSATTGLPLHCTNQEQDEDEEGTDCGGSCPECGVGQSNLANMFYVFSLPGAGVMCVSNPHPAIVFSQEVDLATLAGNIILSQKDNGAAVTGAWRYGSNRYTAILTPTGSCAPNAGNDCLTPSTTYSFTVAKPAAIKTADGRLTLNCLVRSCGPVEFTTGATIDSQPPQIKIEYPGPASILKLGDTIPVKLSFSDDNGIQNISLFEALGAVPTGTSKLALPLSYPLQYYGVFRMFSADFNGDGARDILVIGHGTTTINFFFGNGDGTFKRQAATLDFAPPEDVGGGDFDNDGKIDLVFGRGRSIMVMLGNGDGTFKRATQYNDSSLAYNITVADLNGDSFLDIVTSYAVYYVQTISVFINKGDGTFKPEITYPIGKQVGSIAVGDLTGDGLVDLAVVDEIDKSIVILKGNGQGAFDRTTVLLLGRYPSSIQIADFNGDKKMDLVAAHWTTVDDSVGIILNNGNGTFKPEVNYRTVGIDPNQVAVSDIDGDGVADLVASILATGSFNVFIGKGDGTFYAPDNYKSSEYWMHRIAIEDFNGDGLPDVADLTYPNNTTTSPSYLSVHLNERAGGGNNLSLIGSQSFLGCTASGTLQISWPTARLAAGFHTLWAEALDWPARAGRDLKVVNLKPAHCFDNVWDKSLGEEEMGPPACGGECGLCAGGSCTDSSQCASGWCEIALGQTNGICLDKMRITNVSPPAGAAGDYVTISGNYFGDNPGTAYFSKVINPDVKQAGDWVAAPVVACGGGFDNWSNSQLIVEVPVTAVAGPIKVSTAKITGPDGIARVFVDTSNDNWLPVLPNFTVVKEPRPGICGVLPDKGLVGDSVSVRGKGFGLLDNPLDAIFFGPLKASVSAPGWTDTVSVATVPGLEPGPVALRLVNNGRESNGVAFMVEAGTGANRPLILSVTPGLGAGGEYLTISGRNFGSNVGTVWFKATPNSQALFGSFDFPLECAAAVWADTQIIVKFPKSLGSLDTSYYVQVNRADNQASPLDNNIRFTLQAGSPAPGLCKIDPPSGGPIPLPANQTIKLWGDYFLAGVNDTPVLGLVAYYSFDSDTVAGNVVSDLSGQGNDGVLRGNALPNIPGRVGEAVGLDGAASFVSIPGSDTLLPAEALTLAGWVKKTGPGDQEPRGFIISKDSTYLDICFNNKPLFLLDLAGIGIQTISGGACAPEGVWAHYAGTFDGVTAKLYVNGVLAASVPAAGAVKAGGGVLFLGKSVVGGFLKGQLDEVRVYNRALSVVEVQKLFNLGVARQPDVYFWKVGAATATIARRVAADQQDNFTAAGNKITARPPLDTQTGPVVVYRSEDKRISNPLSFTVLDCVANNNQCADPEYRCCTSGANVGQCKRPQDLCAGETRSTGYVWRFVTRDIPEIPKVVERCWNDRKLDGTYLPSPAPSFQWVKFATSSDDQYNVCRGALATVEFSAGLDQNTITAASVRVFKCSNIDQNGRCQFPAAVALDPSGLKLKAASQEPNKSTQYLSLQAARGSWEDKTYYQVVLDKSIATPNLGGGAIALYPNRPCDTAEIKNSAYCFSFHTDAEDCRLKTVIVTPQSYWTQILEAPMRQHNVTGTPAVDYWGNGLSEQHCVMMDVSGYDWQWASADKNLADIFGPSANRRANVSALGNTVGIGLINPDEAVAISATASTGTPNAPPPRTGTSPLIIDLSSPAVVESWPNCLAACTNAEVAVRFNTSISSRNLPGAPENGTVQLLKCLNENCSSTEPVLDIADVALDAPSNYTILKLANSRKGLSKPLAPNTLYQVIISATSKDPLRANNQIWSAAKFGDPSTFSQPYNQRYTWRFRTKAEACQVERVALNPAEYVAQLVTDRTVFTADGYSAPDACSGLGQKVNPWTLNWQWKSSADKVATVQTFSTRAPNSNCTASCLRRGSDVPAPVKGEPAALAVCGNGLKEAGEDCDRPSLGNGCGLTCRWLGNPDPATCGDGKLDRNLGEACDPKDPDSQVGCSATCQNLGSSPNPAAANPNASICGNGAIGSGEDCDLGIAGAVNNSQSALGCSEKCTHLGTRLSKKWCADETLAKTYGGFDFKTFAAACSQAFSQCGDKVLDADEDTDCDGLGGWDSKNCTPYCLKKVGDSAADIQANSCGINPAVILAGCNERLQHLGSSLLYKIPAVCGDGVVGTGEDASCEIGLAGKTLLFDPWALVQGVGQGTPVPDSNPPEQVAKITAGTRDQTKNGAVVSGEGKFIIRCGYTNDNECAKQYGEDFAVGTDSCCYQRPQLLSVFPATSTPPAVTSNVCPNTFISATFDQEIDPATLMGNVLIARGSINIKQPQIRHYRAINPGDDGGKIILGGPIDVEIRGRYLYVGDYNGRLEIIDISDFLDSAKQIRQPRLVGSLQEGVGDGINAKLSGTTALAVAGNYAYAVSVIKNGLEIIDVSVPSKPRHVAFVAHGDKDSQGKVYLLDGPNEVMVDGDYAYVSSKNGGAAQILNIGNKNDIRVAGTVVNQALAGAVGLARRGNYVYAGADGNTIAVLDVTDKTNPRYVKSVGEATGSKYDLLSVGNYLYVPVHSAGTLEIFDLANPADPRLTSTVKLGDGLKTIKPHTVSIAGNYAFVSDEEGLGSVQVVDVTNPVAPKWAGQLLGGQGAVKLAGAAGATTVSDWLFVAATGANALEIVDIAEFNAEGGACLEDVTSLLAFASSTSPKPWYARAWQSLLRLVQSIISSSADAKIYAVPSRWCAGSDVGAVEVLNSVNPATNATTSLVMVKMNKPLAKDTNYAIVLKPGVKNIHGVSIGKQASGKEISWRFNTHPTAAICEVTGVGIAPSQVYFSRAGAAALLTAAASTVGNNLIQPLPGFYSWQYLWGPEPNPYVGLTNTTNNVNVITAKNSNGEIDIRAVASITDNQYTATRGIVATGKARVIVYLCENPWPPKDLFLNNKSGPFIIFPYEDKSGNNDNFNSAVNNFDNTPLPPSGVVRDGYFNFSTYYCASAGAPGVGDDLPYLKPIVQTSAAALAVKGGSCEFSGSACLEDTQCGRRLATPDGTLIVPSLAERICSGLNAAGEDAYFADSSGQAVACATVKGNDCQARDDYNAWLTRAARAPHCVAVPLGVEPLRCFQHRPLKRFFFTNEKNSDTIGLQIFENRNHLTPEEWYAGDVAVGGQAFVGGIKTIPEGLDGYKAATDGHNIYVDALNYASSTDFGQPLGFLYTNMYLLSINPDAKAETRQVFDKLRDNLRFNTNLTNFGYCGPRLDAPGFSKTCVNDFACAAGEVCSVQIDKLKRNYHRLRDLATIQTALNSFALGNGGQYPAISAGSFLPGQTLSVWPQSWTQLGATLGGLTLPSDPVNLLGLAGTCASNTQKFCLNNLDCGLKPAPAINVADTCALHNQDTGWSTFDRRFSFACASTSLAYRYIYSPLTGYNLRSKLEDTGLIITNQNNFIAGFVNPTRVLVSEESGICTQREEIRTINRGVCGDGQVNLNQNEECDPPGTVRYGQCLNGQVAVDVCTRAAVNNPGCRWTPSSTPNGLGTINCAALTKCGNGAVEAPYEKCDDGAARNGKYGHCNKDCQGYGAGGICGNGKIEAPQELCEVKPPGRFSGWCRGGVNDGAPCDNFRPPYSQCNEDPDNNRLSFAGVCQSLAESGHRKYSADRINSCNLDCQSFGPYCGDNIIQPEFGEECEAATDCRLGERAGTRACRDCRYVDTAAAGWWRLDDAVVIGGKIGTFSDSSGGHTGSCQYPETCPAYEPPPAGKVQGAFNFDGINDAIGVTHHPELMPTSSLTVEAWVNSRGQNTAWARVLEKGGWQTSGGYDLQFYNQENRISFLVFGPVINGNNYNFLAFDSTDEVPVGQWTHVVGTYEFRRVANRNETAQIINLYINGVAQPTTTKRVHYGDSQKPALDGNVVTNAAPLLTESKAPLLLGRGQQDEGYYFNGLLDEVKIYARALSPEEVLERYRTAFACVAAPAPAPNNVALKGKCGDGLVDAGEACDNGYGTNGLSCAPSYGKSCSYCAADCKNVVDVQPSEYCGNGVIDKVGADKFGNPKFELCDLDPTSGIIYAASATATSTALQPTPDHNGYEVYSCANQKQTTDTFTKGTRQCVNNCATLLVLETKSSSCVECGITPGGNTVAGTLVNVLDPASSDPLYTDQVKYLTNGGYLNFFFNRDKQPLEIARHKNPLSRYELQNLASGLFEPAALNSHPLCSIGDPRYQMAVKVDSKNRPFDFSVVSKPTLWQYDLALSPVMSVSGLKDNRDRLDPKDLNYLAELPDSRTPDNIRLVVRWEGSASGLNFGFVQPGLPEDQSDYTTLEDLTMVPPLVGPNYYTLCSRSFSCKFYGLSNHGGISTVSQTNVKSITLNTAKLATSTILFYIRTSDLTMPITRYGGVRQLRVEVYYPEDTGAPVYFNLMSRPTDTVYLDAATPTTNEGAAYWHVFNINRVEFDPDVKKRVTPVLEFDPVSRKIITHPNGRIISGPKQIH